MSKELGLLNFLCILAALGFLVMIVVSAVTSGDFFTIDNLFIITFCLVMSLLFAINPLLYLKSEGKLPLPFIKQSSSSSPASASGGANWGQLRSNTPPLLDAKGRAVPPDVKAMVTRMNQAEATKDA
ncbi:MAG TPA: hypothetical protein VHH35_05510 [Pyrinomonadaceae bacterium]|nr:hypothetical protein [Pyrinomonadaceae bacterium]